MRLQTTNTAAAVLVSTFGLAAITLPARAAVWEAVPDVGIYAATIDNARLDTDLDESSSRSVVDARVRATAVGERGTFRIEPRIRVDIYSDASDDELDNEDIFLRSNGEYRWTGASVGFSADFRQESILRSEIDDAIPDDPDAPVLPGNDSGTLTQFNETRDRLVAAPYARFTLSPRSTLVLETLYTDVSYSGPPVASRTEFDATEVAVGIERRVDERNRVTARLFSSSFEASLTENSTDTVGVEANYRRQLSDIWSMTLVAGVQRSDFIFLDSNDEIVDNASADPRVGVRFRRRGERTLANFSLIRDLEPNASGFVVQRDQLRVYVARSFTERFGGELGVRIAETSSLSDISPSDDRTDSRIELRLEWNLAPRWYLTTGYNYLTREFERQPKADSNEIYLGINYRGLSRQR